MYFLRVDVFPIDKVFISKQKKDLIDLMFSKYEFIDYVPNMEEGIEILNDLFDGYNEAIEKYKFGKLTIEKATTFEGCDIERLF